MVWMRSPRTFFFKQYKEMLDRTVSYGFFRLLQHRGTAGAHGYEVFLSAPPIRCGTAIRAVVSTKPCAIDNVFWDVYEMGEVARKKPFSFHITAAHSPSAHIIEEMELPVPTVDAATLVMNEAFCQFNKSIQDHHSQCSTVSDFKAEILHDTAPVHD